MNDVNQKTKAATELDPIVMGPFELYERLGEGGMGVVWRGVHRDQGVPVAIKVVTAQRLQTERYYEQFRAEVRAAAGLSHPGIIEIYDYGQVSETVERASFGSIPEASPYFAMTLCSRGSLADVDRPLEWPRLQAILLGILDSLAHAHARGVIHRDIKPSNILLTEPTDHWPGVHLSDFGLALVTDWHDSEPEHCARFGGTPAYIAPEQLGTSSRDVGPWSDLYAVGCTAWALATGRPPFGGRSIYEIARKQLRDPLPRFEPRVAVPPDFGAWLRKLLQKSPRNRFRCAADAAWALLRLQQPTQDPVDADSRSDESAPKSLPPESLVFRSFDSFHDLVADSSQWETTDGLAVQTSPSETADGLPPIDAPPLPAKWHRRYESQPSMHLLGTGKSLFGWRRVPLFARIGERDEMWNALAEMIETDRPQTVLLEGAAGTGKSYLARWLCERAAEVGAAQPLRVAHNPGAEPSAGLNRLVATALNCTGSAPDKVHERVKKWFARREPADPHTIAAVSDMITSHLTGTASRDEADSVELTPRRRRALAIRTIALLAVERPVVLWLDDIQWSAESAQLAADLLDRGRDREAPILVVATARTEAADIDPTTSSALEDLRGREQVCRIKVEPLPLQAQTAMIEELLHLERSLARRVADKTGGNALFAVQLIGDWIARDLLEATKAGFVLRDADRALIPTDVLELWENRVTGILGNEADAALPALQLAAALGNDWRADQWKACCELAGLQIPADVLERLVAHRLIEPTEDGFAFVHSVLRESLEQQAREAQRWSEFNQVCARTLAAEGLTDPETAERYGRYCIEGQLWRESLDPLLRAVKNRGSQQRSEAVHLLLDLRRRAIDALELAPGAAASLQNMMLRALTYGHEQRRDEAVALAEEAVSHAEADGELDLRVEAAFRLAQVHQLSDNRELALTLCRDAWQHINHIRPQLAQLLGLCLGELSLRRGKAAEARQYFEFALERARDRDDHDSTASILEMIGYTQVECAALEEARRSLTEAVALREELGSPTRLGRTLMRYGDILRRGGEVEESLSAYQRAVALSRDADERLRLTARFNAALAETQLGRFESAHPQLVMLLDHFERGGYTMMCAFTRAAMLPGLAYQGRWLKLEECFEQARTLVAQLQIVDYDIAIMLQMAGELTAEAGEDDLAERLLALAAAQWESIGREPPA